MHTAQSRRLDRDLGLGEVTEADAGHRVRADIPKLEGLAEGQCQQLEDQAHIVDRQRLLQWPHQLPVEQRLVELGQWCFAQARHQVLLDR
ncbi:hypothetical protein D3C79_1033120 [compost metagenome]